MVRSTKGRIILFSSYVRVISMPAQQNLHFRWLSYNLRTKWSVEVVSFLNETATVNKYECILKLVLVLEDSRKRGTRKDFSH